MMNLKKKMKYKKVKAYHQQRRLIVRAVKMIPKIIKIKIAIVLIFKLSILERDLERSLILIILKIKKIPMLASMIILQGMS